MSLARGQKRPAGSDPGGGARQRRRTTAGAAAADADEEAQWGSKTVQVLQFDPRWHGQVLEMFEKKTLADVVIKAGSGWATAPPPRRSRRRLPCFESGSHLPLTAACCPAGPMQSASRLTG